ncbi:hypothetical protein F4604DRAFT_1503934, partial [Suillus subluteus]
IKDRCAQEVRELSAKANGSHFSVSHTSVQQLEEFSIDVLSEEMQRHAPVLWDLFEVLLAARRKNISDVTSSFEDGDYDDEASLWEQLGDELDKETLLIVDGSKKHGKMITLQNKIITIKKVVILSILMQSSNRKSNTLQSVLGIFLQSTHTP